MKSKPLNPNHNRCLSLCLISFYLRENHFLWRVHYLLLQAITASSTLTIFHTGPSPVHSFSNFTMNASSTPNFAPVTSWMPTTQSFPMSTESSGTSGTAGHPGLVPSVQMITASAAVDSPSSAVPRPSAPVSSNQAVQQQIYPTYTPLPSMASSPQGFWMQHPPMGGFPRPPFVPYPTIYPGPFPSASSGMPHPAPSSDSQPPGVSPLATSPFAPSIAIPANQSSVASGIQTGFPPQGIDNRNVGTRVEAAVNEQSDIWTAHKTDTGIVYYYNALTGESTYEKPAGFKGEEQSGHWSPQVMAKNITTTAKPSWQIPSEVAELRKKQDNDVSKEHAVPVPNIDVVAEKGSTPISLSAPAVSTGGRDAMPLRTSVVPGSSSALDLIKKKLQDSGVPSSSSSSVPVMPVTAAQELNGSRAVDVKGLQSENSKDKLKDANGDGNISDSSSDSEDTDSGPSKEECIMQFKEMLKERGVAPFSKWEKELPKIVFDPRFKAIPSHSARRTLFEHYVKTRAEEERREKRAALKAAIEGFKQLLDEASEDIDHNTNYQTFKRKWGSDLRFEALDRKDRELLLTERVLPLKRAAEEKAQAIRAAAASSLKSMLKEKGDITVNSRWSRVKDSIRDDPRYKCVKHEDREVLFNEYISELKAVEENAERKERVKKEEEEKLKERERELRKRKEREEQEMERVRLKVRRKEAVASFQALLVETIKDPQASWTESKPKLEKDPQGRAANPDLDSSDTEKLFREHIKMLFERCTHDFRALLAEVITQDAAAQETEGGKTVFNSWSTAKRLLKPDPRYSKMPRKEREALWRRYAEDMLRKQKSALDQEEEKRTDAKVRSSGDLGRFSSGSRKVHERR
ncbi:WW domain - like 2 [Theobroma cacao]|nr:WW domain - like 2 [Theobroma cacao]